MITAPDGIKFKSPSSSGQCLFAAFKNAIESWSVGNVSAHVSETIFGNAGRLRMSEVGRVSVRMVRKECP